jgi:periplasmic protein TonB
MSDERLGSTLFLAALVHGVVILGVTFTAAPVGDGTAVPSLNVTLVLETDREELAADTAEFISNRDQRARGQAARGLRPTSTLSSNKETTNIGDPLGADASDGTPREDTPSAEQLVTRGRGGETVPALPQPTEEPALTLQRAATLIQQAAPQTSAMELAMRAELPDGRDDARTLIATPSTRQSGLAEYLDGWRRRVERIGTANYPTELLGHIDAGWPARRYRRATLVGRQGTRPGGAQDTAARRPVRASTSGHPRGLRRAAICLRVGLRGRGRRRALSAASMLR